MHPLRGPQFFGAALKLANGESVERRITSSEGAFRQEDAAKILPTRKH